MEYLEITKKGIPIRVIQSQQIGGLEKLLVGDADRDLVLKTKGKVSVQVGNKFINLLKDDGSLESTISLSNESILITDDFSKVTSKPGQFVFDTTTKLLFLNVNDNLINIKDSLTTVPNPTNPTNNNNDNYIIDNLNTTKNPNVVYSIQDRQHYYNDNGIWKPIYLSHTGGLINGNLSFNKEGNSTIYLYGNQDIATSNLIGIKLENDEGSLNIYNKNSESVIDSDKILNIGNVLYIKNGKFAIGKPNFDNENIIYDSLSIEDLVINDILRSDGFEDIQKYFKEYTPGFGFIRRPDGWELQVDTLVVKNPEKINNISGINNQIYISKSYYLETIATEGTKTIIDLDRTDGIEVGDLLLSVEYVNGEVSYRTSVTVTEIITETIDNIEYKTIYIDKVPREWRMHQEIINLGKTNVMINGEDSSIVAFDTVTNFTDLNVSPETEEDDYIDITLPKVKNVNVKIGNLKDIIDTDFNLNNTDIVGLYSKKGYYKGLANLEYLKLGDALTYENGVLHINNISNDFAEQFKNKKSELITDSELISNIVESTYENNRTSVNTKDYDIGSLCDDGTYTYMVIGKNKIRRF